MEFLKFLEISWKSWISWKIRSFRDSEAPNHWNSLGIIAVFAMRGISPKSEIWEKKEKSQKIEFLLFLRNSAKLEFFVKNGSEDARRPQKAWNSIRFTVIWACRPRGCENMKIVRKIKMFSLFPWKMWKSSKILELPRISWFRTCQNIKFSLGKT